MNQQASVALGVLSNYSADSDVRVVCGGASIKGRRPQQEDVLMIHVDNAVGPVSSNGEAVVTRGPQTGVSLVGVFDGAAPPPPVPQPQALPRIPQVIPVTSSWRLSAEHLARLGIALCIAQGTQRSDLPRTKSLTPPLPNPAMTPDKS